MSDGLLDGSGKRSGFSRIVLLLIWLVILPTIVILVLGILMMVFNQAYLNLVFGIMVVTLVGFLVTGTVLVLVFVSREANLSKLQSDFVSKVSHELRTPLTSIRLFVETLQLKRVTSPGEVDACLDVLNRETGRLTARIERLLDWGRMESGKRVYDKQVESTEAVIRAAVQAFDASHVGRSEPVQLELDPGLPSIKVDHGAIVDALVNLLSNAYKYSDVETRHIRLTAHADDRHVRIAVIDRGLGIAAGRDGQDLEILASELGLQGTQPRHLLPAGAAPGGPEVHQDDLSAVVRQPRLGAVLGGEDLVRDLDRGREHQFLQRVLAQRLERGDVRARRGICTEGEACV